MQTKDMNVTTAWSDVTEGADHGYCTVQIKSGGGIYVFVDSSAPAPTSFEGHQLQKGAERSVSFAGLSAGDRVYVRAAQKDQTVTVTKGT